MNPIQIFQVFFSAFLWALFGVLSKQDEEAFEPAKLLSTIVAALIAAFLQVMYGIDPDTGEQIVTYFIFKTGAIAVIDKLVKVVWRRWLGPWWGKLTIGD